MKLSKVLALLLTFAIILSLAVGCAKEQSGSDVSTGGSGTDTPATAGQPQEAAKLEPITFTFFSGDQQQAPDKDNPVVKKVQELTGVTIEFEFLVGDLMQKMGVLIASGDYPDLMQPSQARSTAMEAGVFIPLDDYLTSGKYPNLQKHYEPYLDRMRAASGNAGKIFLMDNFGRYYGDWRPTYHNAPAFWLQKDVLADAGYPNPKTLDEYFGLIENYMKKYPKIDGQDTLGFEILSFDWRSFCLKNPPQHLIGHPNDGDVVVDQETFVADLYQNKDYAKRYYKKLNEMYHKGIISAETFTQNYDQYLAKIATGRVLGMFDQYWNFQDGERPLRNEQKWERTYVPLEITYEGYRGMYLDPPTFTGGNGMGITVACKDPERALQYIDFMLSEDMQKLLQWGIEGVNYHVDENGIFYRTDEQRKNARDPSWVNKNMADQLWNQFPKMQGIFSDGNWCAPGEQPGEVLAEQAEYDRNFLAQYGFSFPTEFLSPPLEATTKPYYPVWSYTIEDGSEARDAINKITDLENKYLPRLIIEDADKFDAAWDAYVAEIEKVNYKAYLDEVNRQIKLRMNMN
jgi:putative aldouronate transport system substrate-binding protein